jgi:LSD1 subclass zinc finger protein
MHVQLICPNLKCRKLLAVPDELRGKPVKCQYCQTVLRVPAVPKSALAASGKSGK